VSGFVRAINVGIALVALGLYLFVGVMWSRGVWARGSFHFDLGWLIAAVVVSRAVAIKTAGDPLSWKQMFGLVIRAWPGFLFEGAADYSLSRYGSTSDNMWLILFAVFSCALLVFAISWIAVFPYERTFGPPPRKQNGISWRATVWVTGAALAAVLILGSVRPFLLFPDSGGSGSLVTGLESWLYLSSLLVYGFLALTIMFPLLELRLFG
jgi:hypothetical protein